MEIKIGDLVKLKSGSPTMTVGFISEFDVDRNRSKLLEERAVTVYYGIGSSITREVISYGSLKLVDSE